MKQFKPSDLKQYMKVKYRNKGEQVIKEHHYNTIENYCESYDWKLNHMRHSAYDIMEVYEPTLDGWKLLWKREEPKYMLKFPKEMFSVDCKLIECFGTYDRAGIYFNPHTDIKVEFTQEEINSIPFNTDTFVKIEVE